MSTNDVPGLKDKKTGKSKHGDVLAMGCWAENDDGSMILVESVENGWVVYSIFDLNEDPILEYRDKMAEGAFKKAFSWPTDTGDKWTWHDKTPFDWDLIIEFGGKGGVKIADADAQISAAARVARHRKLRGTKFDYKKYTEKMGAGAHRIRDKIQRAIGELRT